MRSIIVWCVAALLASGSQAAELTAAESRWLQGAWPVLVHARHIGLPIDVVVQPQPAAGLPPIAMAWVDGRCKMVFSLRDNPEADATLRRIEPALLDVTLELMAAHELGHCWRHVSGHWRRLPDGMAASSWDPPGGPDTAARSAWDDMRSTRLEEGLADLVGLAWIRHRRAAHYAQLHAWLVAERLHDHVPGSQHDTLRWVHLAQRAERLDGTTIFAAAMALWRTGLHDMR
jgi:hypothetical protein